MYDSLYIAGAALHCTADTDNHVEKNSKDQQCIYLQCTCSNISEHRAAFLSQSTHVLYILGHACHSSGFVETLHGGKRKMYHNHT